MIPTKKRHRVFGVRGRSSCKGSLCVSCLWFPFKGGGKPKENQRQASSHEKHLNIAPCFLVVSISLFWWKKQHVSTGCKMYLLRSPEPSLTLSRSNDKTSHPPKKPADEWMSRPDIANDNSGKAPQSHFSHNQNPEKKRSTWTLKLPSNGNSPMLGCYSPNV